MHCSYCYPHYKTHQVDSTVFILEFCLFLAFTMPPFLINPAQMLRRGLRLVNIDQTKQNRRHTQTNLSDFMSIFGKHPIHLCRIWRDLQTHQHIDHPMGFAEARTKDAFEGFMMANNFVRTYATNVVQAALFKGADKARVGRLKWLYVRKMASLKAIKIVWPANFDEIYIASIDGTHAQTNEPRDPTMRKNPKNYSHKFHMPGRNFEIVLCLWTIRCAGAGAGATIRGCRVNSWSGHMKA